jgi:murein DD-endopeptidase MepM/ murein hydrolase activator NlpD
VAAVVVAVPALAGVITWRLTRPVRPPALATDSATVVGWLTAPVKLPPPPAPPDVFTPEGNLLRRGQVDSGTPILAGLKALGVSPADGRGIVAALQGIYDFRRAQPGHTYEVHLAPKDKRLVYFRYVASRADRFEVKRQDAAFQGFRIEVPRTRHLRFVGVQVVTSLAAALRTAGTHPGLEGRAMGVLNRDPGFQKLGIRPGDTLRIVVNEDHVEGVFHRYGPVLAVEHVAAKQKTRRRWFRFAPEGLEPTYYDERGLSTPRSRLATPMRYTRISSPFGMRFHPVLKRHQTHYGVDLVAPAGTPIRSALPGKVKKAAMEGAYGNLVVVEHGEGLETYYAHLLRFERGIRPGTPVKARQVIGYCGSTGRSTGAHLHFALMKGGVFIDPMSFQRLPGLPVPAAHRTAWSRELKERLTFLSLTVVVPPLPVPASKKPASAPVEDHDPIGIDN